MKSSSRYGESLFIHPLDPPIFPSATVAPGSEPIPNDPNEVHEFRLRVEIECESDGNLWTHPDCEEVSICTYATPPRAKLDIQCTN